MSKKRKAKGSNALGFILSLLVALVTVIATVLLGVIRAIVSLLRWLHSRKTTLPIGSGVSTSWLVITIGLAFSCFGCFTAFATTNAALRQMGVLPTYTPLPTSTFTATPLPTETLTNTPKPTNTRTATRPRPTATRQPPTATRVLPSATRIPFTATASRLQVIPINTNTSEPVVVLPTLTPTQEPIPTQPPTQPPVVGGYVCDGGQLCIKGNINSEGEKIYHFPGCGSYNQTVIDESKGERLFASSAEAEAAGWRRAQNCP